MSFLAFIEDPWRQDVNHLYFQAFKKKSEKGLMSFLVFIEDPWRQDINHLYFQACAVYKAVPN